MIGQRIESRPALPWFSAICLAIALLLVILAVALQDAIWAIWAILPLMIVASLWITRQRAFLAEITEEGLHFDDSGTVIGYGEILSLRPMQTRNTDQFPIHVHHDKGLLVIPGNLNVSSRDLLGFLTQRTSLQDTHPLPAALDDYYQKHAAEFGDDRVIRFQMRKVFGRKPRRRRTIAICVALFLTGLIWIPVGIALGENGYELAAFGGVMIPVAALFAIIFFLERYDRPLQRRKPSGLVVGPVGLALIQGDLSGELGWHEVKQIYYPYRPGALGHSRVDERGGIGIVVDGATFVIVDIYNQPLPAIHERLRWYWGKV
jgi:hypothetical protein